MPVQVLGFDEEPDGRDELSVAPDHRTTRVVAESRGRRRQSVLAGGVPQAARRSAATAGGR